MESTILQRFLTYTHYNTQSDPNTDKFPSTPGQQIFSNYLVAELQSVGLKDAHLDDHGYVVATLPANSENVPAIGFIAHMDTSPDCSGENVHPHVIENYNGKDIILNQEKNIILSPTNSPELLKYINQDLIVTDGTTLLGADDKAGIAEIITAMDYFNTHPDVPHGKICVCFTPDEEIGRGADHFDIQAFGADFAYTVDGGEIGEIEYENFNAAHAVIQINGINVHTGYAYQKMKNATLIAAEFIQLLPPTERPETTKDLEGFYHLNSITGDVEKTTLHYYIRDFDRQHFEQRKTIITATVDKINQKYGNNTASIYIHDQYYNMREIIEKQINIVNIAINAIKDSGIQPIIKPVRGGTDGARLSFMGLPTPNLFAGGLNFHSRYEFIPVQSMNKASEVIIRIIQIATQKNYYLCKKK